MLCLGFGTSHRYARSLASVASERKVLERLLVAAKQRQAATAAPPTPPPTREPGARRTPFLIQTYDAIGPLSLQHLTSARFDYQLFDPASRSRVSGWWWSEAYEPQAIMLRGHSLREDEVPLSVRAVATCGEDPSAIDVEALTRRGIPVFSTPGANANAVKELTLCALLLAARGVVEGIAHTQSLAAEHGDHASLAARIEVDKARFTGGEIAGKTLAVAGLGRVGGLVAEAAVLLGMDVVGYDPTISVDEAWRLPHSLRRVDSLQKAAAVADFLTVHDQADGADAPGRVSASTLASLKPHCNVLNFARGGASGASAVDGAALRVRCDAGRC